MNRINTLDGWRAVAILMVTFFHASMSIWGDRPDIIYYTQFGALGVDVFFGLSGLLITKLLLEEQDRNGHISLKAFYIRRCFRVLIPCCFYVAVISCFSLVRSRSELLSSIFFFRNYLNADYDGPYTVHLWSLAIEEHFYLLWPIVLVTVTPKYGRQVAMWWAVGCGLWRVASAQYFPTLFGAAYPQFRTDYRLDALLWGCVIAFVLHNSEILKRITPLVWTCLLAANFGCLWFYCAITRMWMPMLIPLIIAGTATHPTWRLSRILDSVPLTWIGKVSYSLYLWQMVFLVGTSHSRYWWQQFPANLAMTFITATACYYVIDVPLQRVGHRLAKRAAGNSIRASRERIVLPAARSVGSAVANPSR